MKVNRLSNRTEVYNAPIIPWSSNTYTPVPNSFIMNEIEDKINNLGLQIKNEHYRTALTKDGQIRGVIGGYDITTPDNDFGQRVMFRNSYDKSMSFALVIGMVVWICENGCIKGDYQFKRNHRGVITDETSTTKEAIIDNINGGFNMLETSFQKTSLQLNELKKLEISPKETYDIIGQLFFEKQVISVTQLSTIHSEFQNSKNFRHLGDTKFTAYDLYNHVTESLKQSHPLSYVNDHVETHKLFEKTFNL